MYTWYLVQYNKIRDKTKIHALAVGVHPLHLIAPATTAEKVTTRAAAATAASAAAVRASPI